MSDEILFEIAEGVAEITLNRPNRLNALTFATLDGLRTTLDRAVVDGARAVLITGAGRAFCSGADLLDTGRTTLSDPGEALEKHYNPLAETLAGLPIPIVTAVNGPAAGAGCSLALAGDFTLIGESGYLLLAFVNIGLVPDMGATWLVAKGAGRAKALEMMLLGERMSARQAVESGLAYRAVADAELLGEARALARRLASGPSVAMGLIRTALRDALASTLTEALAAERRNQSKAGATEDARAAILAFATKAKPEFKGR